jgi:hypothetical protein
MGEIRFEGEPPFLVLPTQQPTARRSGDGVRLTVFASVAGKHPDAFEIQFPLTPDQATELARQLGEAARQRTQG